MKVSELTDEQLNYWCAKAQGWETYIQEDTYVDDYEVWYEKNPQFSKYTVKEYAPSTNGQQAMELMKKFNDISWHEEWDAAFKAEWDRSPERAICMAVIASVYGDEVSDE